MVWSQPRYKRLEVELYRKMVDGGDLRALLHRGYLSAEETFLFVDEDMIPRVTVVASKLEAAVDDMTWNWDYPMDLVTLDECKRQEDENRARWMVKPREEVIML